MERMWAPWRIKYLQNVDNHDEGCIFCTKPAKDEDRKNLILCQQSHSFVIMNLYPYNNGHLMVVPRLHTASIAALAPQCVTQMWNLLSVAQNALSATMHPDGFNIGMNLGRTAGAGIEQHVHMHIVPRWNGDTNFMPVLAETRVISQGIFDTYDMLLPYFSTITP